MRTGNEDDDLDPKMRRFREAQAEREAELRERWALMEAGARPDQFPPGDPPPRVNGGYTARKRRR